MAEWLCSGTAKAVYAGSIPASASRERPMSKKICIFGLGYRYSIAAMLAKDNFVLGIDLDQRELI